MSAILVAAIAALGSVMAAALASRASARSRTLEQDHAQLRDEHETMQGELDRCTRERTELRRRLELVTAAIIRTLPREQRINLLAELDERIPPFTTSTEAA